MRARTERLKNRGDQLRASGLSVSATLQLYAGAVVSQQMSKGTDAEQSGAAEEDSQLVIVD